MFLSLKKGGGGERDAKVMCAINLVLGRALFDTLRATVSLSLSLSVSPSVSHKRAAEFRELLNEPSSRKPLITKGLSERRAGGKREESIFTGRQPVQ